MSEKPGEMPTDNPGEMPTGGGETPAPGEGTTAEYIEKLKAENIQQREKYQRARDQLDEISKRQAQAEEEAAKKRGEFESLYTDTKAELDRIKGDAEKFGGIIEKFLATEIDGIPEDKRDLVPDLPPEQRLEWIRAAKEKGLFAAPTKPAPGARVPGEGGSPTYEEDIRAAKTRTELRDVLARHGRS